jgi:hypothetical protein
LTATRELVVPTSQKQYIVQNNTAGDQSITVKTSGGTGITVPNGRKAHLYVDGTNVVQMFDFVDINGGAIDGTAIGAAAASTGAFTSLAASGTTTLSGLTASTALALDASKNVVSVTNTGTGNNVLATSPTLVTPALGTPASGVVTNLTGTASININGTVGATTASTGAFTTLSATGVTTVQAGTVSAPAITTTGDTNTGIFFPAADTIAFAEGGAEAMRIDSSGNVGIGVVPSVWGTNFSAKALQIGPAGSISSLVVSDSDRRFTFTNNAFDNSAGVVTRLQTGPVARYNQAGGVHTWSNAASDSAGTAVTLTERMRIDNAGNVGIGTSSPAAKLDVSGKAKFTGVEIGVGEEYTSNIYFEGGFKYRATGFGTVIGASSGAITFSNTASSGSAGASATVTERMRIDSAGNVGIGTTSPAAKIHASGDIGDMLRLDRANTGAVGNQVAFRHSNAGTLTETAAINAISTANADTGTLAFYTKPTGGSNTERLRITSAGNVGIGTSSPGFKLHVRGPDATANLVVGNTSEDTRLEVLTYQDDKVVLRANDTSNTARTLAFETGTSERARITSGGDFIVTGSGANTSGTGWAGFQVAPVGGVSISRNGSNVLAFFHTSNAGGTSGSPVGTVSITTTATTYATSSDYRLKHDIQPMTGALAKVQQLKPVTYKWNADDSESQGFIAHELQEVVPECVTGEKDAVDAEGKPQYQGIDTSFLVATLTAAIQEQQAIINDLKARLDAANL